MRGENWRQRLSAQAARTAMSSRWGPRAGAELLLPSGENGGQLCRGGEGA